MLKTITFLIVLKSRLEYSLLDLKKFSSDDFIFAKNLETDLVIKNIVYIDNFSFFSRDIANIDIVKRFLPETFKIKHPA